MELLAAVAVIAVVVSLIVGVFGKFVKSASQVRELSAAKNLITAYTQAANDNNGQFMPGFDETAGEFSLPDGTVISGPPAHRYPYRLAAYFDYELRGNIIVNDNLRQIGATDTYFISLFPAFGINYLFVGGNVTQSSNGPEVTGASDCITRQSKACSVLVFATAAGAGAPPGGGSSTGRISGYCKLTPPNYTTQIWSNARWTKEADPALYGNVDARCNGAAICAFLDGSVRRQTIDDLRDMRLWNGNALAQNNPNYLVPPPPRTGGRL